MRNNFHTWMATTESRDLNSIENIKGCAGGFAQWSDSFYFILFYFSNIRVCDLILVATFFFVLHGRKQCKQGSRIICVIFPFGIVRLCMIIIQDK